MLEHVFASGNREPSCKNSTVGAGLKPNAGTLSLPVAKTRMSSRVTPQIPTKKKKHKNTSIIFVTAIEVFHVMSLLLGLHFEGQKALYANGRIMLLI